MTKAFSIFGSSSRPQLGPFEQQLLQELWSHGSATVRELLADGRISQAYTTVMTTVDRLYKKGLLDRVAEGRAFRYTPRHTPEELQRVTALENIRQLLGSGDASSLPLSYLVEALSAHDAQLLDELQLLVERKRRELQSRGAEAEIRPAKRGDRSHADVRPARNRRFAHFFRPRLLPALRRGSGGVALAEAPAGL